MQPDAGNRFSLVAKISLNMICIIILRSAQMYATLFALPNFIVQLQWCGRGQRVADTVVVKIQCQQVKPSFG